MSDDRRALIVITILWLAVGAAVLFGIVKLFEMLLSLFIS